MHRLALSPAVVLVEPREEGNIGAAARAMANMGLEELVLVNPSVTVGRLAGALAVNARHVLERARCMTSLDEALAPYQRIVGTTSGRGREVPPTLLSPRQLAANLLGEQASTSTAIIFGPETSGLDNAAISRCGLMVRVPCDAEHPTLNLAQAVLIVAYELYLARLGPLEPVAPRAEPAAAAELQGLFEQLLPLLIRIGFARDDTFEGVFRDLRRLGARSGVTRREIEILRGICRRAQHALDRPH